MAQKESKSKVWLISLIAALLIFFAGFFLGVKYYSWFFRFGLKMLNFLAWFIPLLLILFIAFLVIRHMLKKRKKEKEKEKAEAEAAQQAIEK